MTTEKCRDIVRERMLDWGARMALQHSTPALAISIGHDEQAGAMHLFVPEGLDREFIRGLLRFALKDLDAGVVVT